MWQTSRKGIAMLFAAVAVCANLTLGLPPGFVDEPVLTGWNEAAGLAFSPVGDHLVVWEKAGRVWLMRNGQRQAAPLLDINDEVNAWRDFGLLGFALDPAFETNGYIYALYTVDHHHLQFFGTPNYNPAANDIFVNTIARLTRFTTREVNGIRTADPASRFVLIGETAQTGFPVCHQSHSIGSLAFAADGTLLVSNGDGASYELADTGGPIPSSSNTALAEGIITPKEDVGAFRAQLVDSLSGKILRIDPATGNGLASNPFYDASAPRAPRSRVWGMGLRNPFRFSIKPGTGGTNPAAGMPGELWIGDVGWADFEELNRAPTGGLNFGWPLFEGLTPGFGYPQSNAVNLDAPNPLNGVGGCTIPAFRFRDLLVQDTLAATSWPNPCNPLVQIPASVRRFEHTRPVLDWRHGSAGPARVPTYTGNNASQSTLGTPGCPVSGPSFGGNSVTGGVWYTATSFPPEYRGAYFFADFGEGWLRALHLDASGNPMLIEPISDTTGFVVCMAVNPADGALYYINYDDQGQAVIRRIRATNDRPPVVVASASPAFGPLPLTVSFSTIGTTDPEGLPLSYGWDFGDGSAPALTANPTHVFTGRRDITASGTIVARVFSLNPPGPTGGGNHDPQIIRDGDTPPLGNDDSARQFDTFHGGDQGTDDWIGYTFPTSQRFTGLVFQEGKHFFDGGWFNSIRLEYRTGGVWLTVPGFTSSPLYSGNNGLNFETFRYSFPPVTGDGLRIRGVPGGSARFISIGELRVLAEPLSPQPTRYDVTLRVSDPIGNTVIRSLVVSGNNTPPVVNIASPLDGSLYNIAGGDVIVPLRAIVTDAEHSGSALMCSWQTALHHNDHTHPESPDPACQTQSLLSRIGCDGETYFYEFTLTVTDAAGLSTTVASRVYPNCCRPDFNNDGLVDPDDLADYITAFFTVPPSPATDFNRSGTIDPDDFADFIAAFFQGCP